MVSGDGTSFTALAYLTPVDALILAEDSRMELVGPRDSALEYLARFTATPQRRVWNPQRILSVHQVRLGSRLNARSRAQGTDLRLVVPRRALLRSPLHGCVEDPIRVGPVPGSVRSPGRSGPRSAPRHGRDGILRRPLRTPAAETFWWTRDPELVERATQTFLEVWDTAVPVGGHQSRDPSATGRARSPSRGSTGRATGRSPRRSASASEPSRRRCTGWSSGWGPTTLCSPSGATGSGTGPAAASGTRPTSRPGRRSAPPAGSSPDATAPSTPATSPPCGASPGSRCCPATTIPTCGSDPWSRRCSSSTTPSCT